MTTKRHGIISAGTWAHDRIKVVDTWPQEEHLAKIIATDMQGGGSGHNLAVDIRRLDSTIPVDAIGLLGSDTDGDFLIAKAKEAGVNVAQLHQTDSDRTSFTDVMSDNNTGKRTFFHYTGTSDLLSPAHFDFDITHGKILHLGLLGVHKNMDSQWQDNENDRYENGWVAVLEAAKAKGIATNLELVSIAEEQIQALALPCLPYLDSLIINEYELSALSGMAVTDENGVVNSERCVLAANSLFDKGTLTLVVVHYPQAAIAVTNKGEVILRPSFNVHPSWIKSAVGAGDAFAAGMLYGIHEGWSHDASLELGHACAAASLRDSTTVGSVESISECMKFANSAHIENTSTKI